MDTILKNIFSTKRRSIIFPGLMLFGTRCLEPCCPSAIKDVVDGFINGSNGTARVKWSNATSLSDPNPSAYESHATVIIGDGDGSIHTLTNVSSGEYLSSIHQRHTGSPLRRLNKRTATLNMLAPGDMTRQIIGISY